MDLYRFAIYLGFTGLACMALLGVSHLGLGHHSHGAGHGTGHGAGHGGAHGGLGHGIRGGHGHAVAVPGASAHSGHGHANHGGHGHASNSHVGHARAASGGGRYSFLLGLLSPRLLFSLSLGFGATGILVTAPLPMEPARFVAALAGAALWEKLIMSPAWSLWMGFASNPARTLESAVFEEAEAIMNFDVQGSGLVSIDLDGHEMRILAQLLPAQLAAGQRVRTGDKLFVEGVDAQRNTCTVSVPGGVPSALPAAVPAPLPEPVAEAQPDAARPDKTA